MTGTIVIRGLRLASRLGVNPEERRNPQALEADIHLRYDIGVAAASGRIEDAIDYSDVARSVTEWAAGREMALIESLGASMVDHLLEVWPSLEGVSLALRKFPLPKADSVELNIEKNRG